MGYLLLSGLVLNLIGLILTAMSFGSSAESRKRTRGVEGYTLLPFCTLVSFNGESSC